MRPRRVIVYENRSVERVRIGVLSAQDARDLNPRAVSSLSTSPHVDLISVPIGKALVWNRLEDGREGYLFEPVERRRMITDPNIRAVIARMEGARWLEEQEEQEERGRAGRHTYEESFIGAVRAWAKSGGGVIYGRGGVHRYPILLDGEVVCSKSHGRASADKASAAGFRFDGVPPYNGDPDDEKEARARREVAAKIERVLRARGRR